MKVASYAVVLLATAVLAPVGALADPVPTTSTDLPFCGVAPDDDGKYCIVSFKLNGVEQPQHVDRLNGQPTPQIEGQRYSFGVRVSVEPQLGGVSANVSRYDWEQVNEFGAPAFELAAIADGVFRIEVNIGSQKVRGFHGRARDHSFAMTSGAGGSNVLVFEGKAVDVAMHSACESGCGGSEQLVAQSVVPTFGAYFTDWSSQFPRRFWGAQAEAMRQAWTGFETVSNIQVPPHPTYDRNANAIVLRMAGPHFASPGVVALGQFAMFLPYGMLQKTMEVPNPKALGAGAFLVTRDGTSGTVPIRMSHEQNGIRLRVSGITFSSPTYRVKLKPARPGAVRVLNVRRATRTSASLTVVPTTTGGRPILRHVVSCSAKGQRTRIVRSTKRSILVKRLAPGVAYTCRAYVTNSVGASPARTVRVPRAPVRRGGRV